MDYEARAERRKARREKFLKLLGGKCAECGSKKDLHFDHVRPTTKTRHTSRLWDANEADVQKELKNCQLLCADCHHQKSLDHADYGKPSEHGTLWRYIKHKCRCKRCRARMSEYYYSRL